MICSKCGKQLLPNEVVCSSCGQSNEMTNLNNSILVNNIPNMNNNFNQTMVNMNTIDNVNDVPVNLGEVLSNDNIEGISLNNSKKNKKGLIIILSVVAVLLLIGIIALVINPFTKDVEEKDTKKLIENTYTMYVKINPLVKLSVKEKYYECKNEESGKFEKCSDITDEVISYNLVNNDAKEVYKDIDLKMKNVVDALVALYDTARENEIEFTDIEITTNWDNRYSKVELVDSIKKQSKYSNEFNIVLDVEKGNIAISDILDKYGIEEEVDVKYTVVFNSEGGSLIAEQEVKENEKVVKPNDPTRTGYTFVEWQLNGVKYDFDLEVKSDIELKAKWEQIVVKEETPKQEEKPKEEKPKEEEPPKEEEIPKEDEQPKDEPPKVEESPKEEMPKEEPKQESTLAKINLNDNIMVYFWDGYDTDRIMMGYIFSTNVNEVFDDDVVLGYDGIYEIYNNNANFMNKYNQLQFDIVKEQQRLSLLENLSNNPVPGVSDLVLSINLDHMFNYRIKQLGISFDMQEEFSILSNQLDSSIFNFENQVKALFKDAVYIAPDGIGAGPSEPVLLTEQICNEYHLTCDRW